MSICLIIGKQVIGLYLFGAVPLLGAFWINVVFPLVIHSGTFAPCRHLFISNASLPWMEVYFMNQNPSIPSWPGIFQFHILFSVILSKSRCISALGPSSSRSSSLVILFIHTAFRYVFLLLPYFLSQIVRFLWHLVVGPFSRHPLPIVDRIFFRCFGISTFVCNDLPFVDISLIFLFWSVISGLFPQVVLLFFTWVACSFLFLHISVPLFFIILACFRRFFYLRFQSNFPSWFWVFLRAFLRGSQFS